MLRALIFDVDGTLANTEEAHRVAFNQAFSEFGLDWHWDRKLYTELLEISGGKERMRHYWQRVNGAVKAIDGHALQDTIARLHEIKTAYYEAAVQRGEVVLRPGVLALLESALSEGMQLAIATTTSPVNIATLLQAAMGPDWRHHFSAIGDASSAALKKPHPQLYQQMLDALSLDPQECLAFEDSGNGLKAATLAGLATIVTPTHYTQGHDFSRALQVLPSLEQVSVDELRHWHAAHWTGERYLVEA